MGPTNIDNMRERSCPLCATRCSRAYMESNYDQARLNEFSFASRKTPELMHHRLVRCPECDLLYSNPAPDQDHLEKLYRDAGYDSQVEARYAARTYIKALSGYLGRLPDLEGALDIGAGDGAFLERVIEAGFSGVAGVEPSEAPVKAARSDIAPLIRKIIFSEDAFMPQSLRLITCFQTLEHLHDPFAACKSAYSLLKTPGIFFTVVHNYRSFSAKVLGEKSPIFDIEHMQLFSPGSVRYMFEKAGFGNIVVFPLSNVYPLRYWLRLLPLSSGLKATLINTLDRAGIGSLPIPLRAGNMAAIGYRE